MALPPVQGHFYTTSADLATVLGSVDDTTPTTDPTAAGQTVAEILRGILVELKAQTVLLNDIKTNTSGG